jgi:hypothetical protein
MEKALSKATAAPVQGHTEDRRQMARAVPRRRCRWFAGSPAKNSKSSNESIAEVALQRRRAPGPRPGELKIAVSLEQ